MSERFSADRLYELAELHDGYFTAAEAVEFGFATSALVRYVARGTLERKSRGVYRLARFPETSLNAYLWASVLWPQSRSAVNVALSHETALRLHELSDVNPSHVDITVPKSFRIRRDHPQHLRIYRADLEPYDLGYIDGFVVTTVDRTLRDMAASGNSVVFHAALRDARAKNLKIPREFQAV